MKIFKVFGGFIIAIVIAVISMSVYTVDEREQALVFRFGEIIRADTEPGIKFKMPFVNSVKFFDDRIQTMDAEPQSYLTLEKKNLIVDSFVKWRIRDVREYYVRLGGSKARAHSRLSKRVNDAIRDEIGKRSVKDVVSGDRVLIMDTVRKATDQEAAGLGLEIVDTRLKRVDLDPAISETVYNRMRAERERVAKELRAQGEEEAEKIRANADRQRQILLAEANRTAEKIKGEGDAGATIIYADAYGKDEEFFKFYKSLEAYQRTFNDKSDLFIVDPNSDFMKYMDRSSPN
ncbi:MAG: protease modulator HflC [Proteobacteria bacterium]|nr:protease modulator HflC [Pseudomonadota bacterium]